MGMAIFRIRLLPALMGAMALLLTVKIGGLVQELRVTVGSETEAQTQAQPAVQPSAGQPPAEQPPAAQAPTELTPSTQTAQQPTTPAEPAPAPAATTQQPAAQQPAMAPEGEAATAEDAAPQPESKSASQAAIDPFAYTDEEVDVLQQLSKRRIELDAKARELDEREALVAAAEQRMDQKMAELKAMQSTLQDLLKKRSEAEETQLQSLVRIYENMKPKAAAGVFEELDMDILLEVVSRMKERKVAPILAMMTPTKAKELTFELAQRQQLPIAP
jgi:flagellar motility protein MotE (MotC chaperone)